LTKTHSFYKEFVEVGFEVFVVCC